MKFTESDIKASPTALIISVGNGSGNAMNYIYENHKDDFEFLELYADMPRLFVSKIPLQNKLLIGKEETRNWEAYCNPEWGRLSAIYSADSIKAELNPECDVAFIIAGMGGGVGTGAAPVVAQICKSVGLYTIAICSIPFAFESYLRQRQAASGIEQLKQNVDNIFIFSNDAIRNFNLSLQLSEAFEISDKMFSIPIDIFLSLLRDDGIVSLDYADFRKILNGSKLAAAASGTGTGENRMKKAFENVKKSPFLSEISLAESKKILMYISYGLSQPLLVKELNDIIDFMKNIKESVNITWGTRINSTFTEGEVNVSIIIT